MTSQFNDQLLIGYGKTITGFKNIEFHNPNYNKVTTYIYVKYLLANIAANFSLEYDRFWV